MELDIMDMLTEEELDEIYNKENGFLNINVKSDNFIMELGYIKIEIYKNNGLNFIAEVETEDRFEVLKFIFDNEGKFDIYITDNEDIYMEKLTSINIYDYYKKYSFDLPCAKEMDIDGYIDFELARFYILEHMAKTNKLIELIENSNIEKIVEKYYNELGA